MKKILILSVAVLLTAVSYGQKKHDKESQNTGLTYQQMDSAITVIYNSFETDRQVIQNQMAQATDQSLKKALSYQWNALETRCANRIWGYIISQPQSETTLQMMMRLRTTVDKEIVVKSFEQIKDKKLLQTKPAEVLSYYISNDQAQLGEKFKEIEVPALGPEGKALKLSDEVAQKSILLILGATTPEDIPASFNVFCKKIDFSSMDIIQVGLYNGLEEAANAVAEYKSDWRFFADTRGAFSPVVLDYNIQETPLCVLIEKTSGKIVYMGVGINDDLMGVILTH